MTHLNSLKHLFLRYYRDMGLRVFLYALLSLAATLVAPLVPSTFQLPIDDAFDFSSVTPVLTILASSMLAVTTFSLNIMVSTHRAAADTSTPRMHRILLSDTTTQSTLSAFIGAFVYSLGSIILYHLGFYPDEAAIVVMTITTIVAILVVVSLLRWIDHLTTLGSLENILSAARHQTETALNHYAENPLLGTATVAREDTGSGLVAYLRAPQSGFVQLIDVRQLQQHCPDETYIHLKVKPGSHLLKGQVIAKIQGQISQEQLSDLEDAFTFGPHRTVEQDAEQGLITLSEIGSKALSPGINDPGTAIETVIALKELLWAYGQLDASEADVIAPNVTGTFAGPDAFVEAAFAAIARDGASTREVVCALWHSLGALKESANDDLARAADAMLERVRAMANMSNMSDLELEQIREEFSGQHK
ncbi:MAG: DUF2254 domain-containing protein [Pseudomonadota bacterium]